LIGHLGLPKTLVRSQRLVRAGYFIANIANADAAAMWPICGNDQIVHLHNVFVIKACKNNTKKPRIIKLRMMRGFGYQTLAQASF
jgi:hypothetical protein